MTFAVDWALKTNYLWQYLSMAFKLGMMVDLCTAKAHLTKGVDPPSWTCWSRDMTEQTLAVKATITTCVCLGRSEVLRSLRHFEPTSAIKAKDIKPHHQLPGVERHAEQRQQSTKYLERTIETRPLSIGPTLELFQRQHWQNFWVRDVGECLGLSWMLKSNHPELSWWQGWRREQKAIYKTTDQFVMNITLHPQLILATETHNRRWSHQIKYRRKLK